MATLAPPPPAAIGISLFPTLRLYLDESACIGSDDDQFEGSEHQLRMPGTPPELLLRTTEELVIVDEEIMNTSEDALIVLDDEEEEELSREHRLALPLPTAAGGHQTRASQATPENEALRTLVPTDPNHYINTIGPMDEGWITSDSLLDLRPPVAPPGMRVLDTRSQEHFYKNTETLGRFLIRRGFPLIGQGSSTLVFLLTQNTVAKVAKYRIDVNANRFRMHRAQRNQDVLLSRDYPSCFAETRYKRVNIAPPTDDKSHWSYFGWFHDLYIQELLQPIRSISSAAIGAHPNAHLISQMINRNRHLLLHQWGMTRVKSVETFVRDDTVPSGVKRVSWTLSWLVAYDYE